MKKTYQKKKVHISILSSFVLIFCVICLTIGFSAYQASIDIRDISATVRVQADIRVTGVSVLNTTSGAYSNYEDYNVKNIHGSVHLPNADSTITYEVQVTNIGNVMQGIYDIDEIYKIIGTNTDSNLEIKNKTVDLKEALCDDTNQSQCKLGSVTTFSITIGYATNGYDANHTDHLVELDFYFRRVFGILYNGFTNVSGLPTQMMEGDTKVITFNNTTSIPSTVLVTGATGSYTSPNLTLSNITIDNVNDSIVVTKQYFITYTGFSGNTSGLISRISASGGGITFNNTTGIPVKVAVTGATGSYSRPTLTLSNITSDITITATNATVDGEAVIERFEMIDESNLKSESHTINGLNVNFNVVFNNNGQNDQYYVVYEVTIVNYSIYDYDFETTTCIPSISAGNNNIDVSYNVTGIYKGEKIKGGDTKTFQIKVNATISSNQSGDINVGGDINNDFNPLVVGSLIGTIDTIEGDLVNNDLAHFNVSVENTYETDKTFTFALANSNNFTLVNCSDGSLLSSMSIAKETTQNFDFCVKKNDDIVFASSPQTAVAYLRSQNLDDYLLGALSLAVPITVEVDDDAAPIISNLTVTKTFGNSGNVVLKWDSSEENNISKYYIVVNKEGSTPYTVNTIADETTYTFTNIEEDVNYTFIVYGEDEFGNSGASNVANPSSSSGEAVASSTSSFKWTYNVTYELDNALNQSGNTTILEGTNYTSTLSVTGWNALLRKVPDSLDSVTMGGVPLSACSNANGCTSYYYSNGNITVYNVTGDLKIKATSEDNGCLTKGTDVLLANGKYKKIEDIYYDDLLAVWSYDTGSITYEYPIWIEQEHKTTAYQRTTFSDGSVLKTVGFHGVYDLDNKKFISVDNPQEFKVGTKIAKIKDGQIFPIVVRKIETIYETTTYYHVASTTYFNIIANNILTTDGTTILSNLYGFEDYIKWPKSRESIISDENNLYKFEDLNGSLPYHIFLGGRASEAKYIVNQGYMTDELLQNYFRMNQNNPYMIREPIVKNGSHYWPVSIDNRKKELIKEGEEYTLPDSKVNCYFNTSNNKCYKPKDKITIYYGTHFISK